MLVGSAHRGTSPGSRLNREVERWWNTEDSLNAGAVIGILDYEDLKKRNNKDGS
jgi:hypothetical protein